VILLKRIYLLLTGLVLVTGIGATTATASDDPPAIVLPSADTVYCLKGGLPDASKLNIAAVQDERSTTMPSVVSYEGGSRSISQEIAEIVIQEPNGRDGAVYVGNWPYLGHAVFFIPDEDFAYPTEFDPGYWLYYVARGACIQMADRHFFLCYANNPNSVGIYTRKEAQDMLDAGAKVPVASTSQVTNFPVGSHYLTCNAGGQKATGHFVSTGNGGELATSDTAGAGLVTTNPLDWTLEVS
jgi:hypothetical protein